MAGMKMKGKKTGRCLRGYELGGKAAGGKKEKLKARGKRNFKRVG
jgi:hypothetical protein